MPWVDIILVLAVGSFVFSGFFFGFIHTLGNLVGTVAGLILATRWVDPVLQKFGFLFGTQSGVARIVTFLLLFFLISRGIGLLFWVADRLFGFLRWIPFAKSLNRLGGGILGFAEGVIVVGAVLFFIVTYLPTSSVRGWLDASEVSKYLLTAMSGLQGLLPAAWRIVTRK